MVNEDNTDGLWSQMNQSTTHKSTDTGINNSAHNVPNENINELFDNIIGHNDVKKLFKLSLSSDIPVHILLVGPPASAKTLFMLECIKLERSHFIIGSQSTKNLE